MKKKVSIILLVIILVIALLFLIFWYRSNSQNLGIKNLACESISSSNLTTYKTSSDIVFCYPAGGVIKKLVDSKVEAYNLRWSETDGGNVSSHSLDLFLEDSINFDNKGLKALKIKNFEGKSIDVFLTQDLQLLEYGVKMIYPKGLVSVQFKLKSYPCVTDDGLGDSMCLPEVKESQELKNALKILSSLR